MAKVNVPGRPANVKKKIERAKWVNDNKKYLNKVRKTYTGASYSKDEFKRLALGGSKLIKQALKYQKYEDYRVTAKASGYVGKDEDPERLRKEMKWLSSKFDSPSQVKAYLAAKGKVDVNLTAINDYLRATGQAELSTDKTGVNNLAQVDPNRYLWERRLAGMTADSELVWSNVTNYSLWANAFVSFGDAKPTWEQVKGAIKQYGSVAGYQNYRKAQGDVAQLSEDVISMFGADAQYLDEAYIEGSAYQSMLTEIDNYAAFNPLYKARFGANITRDTLSELAAKYQTGANYGKFLGAQTTAQDMLRDIQTEDLSLWGAEPMSPEALADAIYGGQELTLQDKIEAARARRKGAFTAGKSTATTERTEGGLLTQNLF